MRRVNKDIRKKEILNKAMEVFSQHGYKSASLEGIAKKLKIGKSTIYEYFKDKKELFIRSLERMEEEAYRFIKEKLKKEKKPDKKFELVLLPSDGNRELWRRFLKTLARISVENLEKEIRDIIEKRHSRWIKLLKEIYEDAVKKGIFIKTNYNSLCLAFTGISKGYLIDTLPGCKKNTVAKWKKALSLLLDSLKKKSLKSGK